MATQSFGPKVSGDLSFTNITISETDTGLNPGEVSPLLPYVGALLSTDIITGENGLSWVGFNAELTGGGPGSPAASIQFTLSFDVTATGTNVITGFDQFFQTDFDTGAVSASAIETVTDSNNNVVGTATWVVGAGATPIILAQGYQSLHVSLTFTESVAANSSSADNQIGISIMSQGFTEAPAPPPPQLAALGDYVWYDANDNGVQDASEAGISGVTVELENAAGTSIISTTTTDANGNYLFSNLVPGTYEVQFVAPAGSGEVFSPTGQGTASTDSNPNASGLTGPVTLVAGQTDLTIDAGLFKPAALGDYVWYDANDNGVQDASEAGISGVTVELENAAGTSIISTTTTDANGNYLFSNLVPGTYEVQFVAPAGSGEVFSPTGQGTASTDSNPNASGLTGPVTLVAGQTDLTIDAGLFKPAALGDYVWYDANDNGVQDASEAGISGVTVELENSAGTSIISTTTTDANGNYLFSNLLPGTYEVQFVAPAGSGEVFSPTGQGTASTDSNPNASGLTGPVTLVAGQTDLTIDAGLFKPAALGDYVWYDANDNGVQDASEAGISGVTVELENAAGTSIISTTTTDANGKYLFSNLLPGTYEVQFVAPAGSGEVFSPTGQGTASTDSNPNASGLTGPVTLVAGQTDLTIDAGLFKPAALGDYVWYDANDNGVQDASEAGISGVTVELENAAGTSIISTTTTDANGKYLFSNLLPGTYEVQFVAPAGSGEVFSPTGQGTASTDSNPNASGLTGPVTLVAGQTDLTIDAGLFKPAALGDYVWYDANDNGVQDASEAGISGVTVELENAAGTSIISTTTTDANGNYLFSNLVPGTYEVQFVAPAGSGEVFSPTGQGTASTDSNPNASGLTGPVTLVAGQTDLTIDAGLFKPAALGDYVWYDANDNGVQDASEAGISGVTVELENSAGTSIISTTTTDANGKYLFSNLLPGTYEVQFVAPAGSGEVFSPTGQGTASTDSNPNASGLTGPVTLVAGQTDLTIDAGLFKPAALGDYVWYDANDNGVQDASEAGISGVTVELENAAGTSIISTTTTDANGKYLFSNLLPGTYEVQFVAPAGSGEVFSPTGQGTASTDSNPNASGLTGPVTLVAGQTDLTIDAGLFKPAALGDYVWQDLNANGIQDSGEPGVSGVTVELENAAGTSIIATTTTDASGAYHFTGLLPGTYEVQFVAPTGEAFTLQNQGNAASDSNANQSTGQTAPVTLAAGQTDNTIDAGLVLQSGGGTGGPPPGITVIKLPCAVVVGTCGQVTYTYDVTNTGSVPVSGITVVDNIGTAAKPNDVTPNAVTSSGYNVGDGNHNGVLDPGETWVYQNTINESGNYNSKSSSAHCSVSGQNLGGGCTTWFNSSFTPTSCKDGATYTFQNITCTVSGPGCGTFTECVPNAVVTFSNSCSQATTTYDSSQNCWVTTLPANCNPGDVFLSGLPWQVPNGCNLSGATVTWNIGQSANNCGSSSVNWQVGCQGYSDFGQNGCNGNDDYNQIGVKACDNQSGYGSGGSTDWGYGYDTGGSGAYCNYGWGCGGSNWGGWSGWDGSSNDCAGTPENQYTSSNCGSNSGYGGGGCGGWGYGGGGGSCGSGGGNNDGGTCGNGSGSGSCSQGQLCNSPEADTVTVTATTLGQGFSLGDAGNYGIIAFNPTKFVGSSSGAINGNVGLGVSCGSTTVQLNGEKITGNLVSTGTKPSSTGGTVTGSITGSSATLAADITALKALSTLLAGEAGTSIALTSGMVIQASSGTFDAMGDEVFKITKWANNITINGDGTHNVVLDFASGITPNLDNVTLTGGLTAGEVLFNYTGTSTISGTSGNTFNASLLAPNAVFNVSTNVTVNGDLFGGTSGQAFTFNGGSKLTDPATGSGGPPTTTTTVTASDSKEVEVLCSNSNISVNGSTPTGSLSSLYGKASTIEFSYSPSDTVHVGTANIGSSTGHNADSLAFIEISNKSTPFASGAQIYFQGEVTTGEKIFADATLNQLTNTPVAAPNNVFSTTPGADIYMYVFHSQSDFQNHVAPIQSEMYNTSGSQAMHFNDQIGSLKVVGYIGATGGHLVS